MSFLINPYIYAGSFPNTYSLSFPTFTAVAANIEYVKINNRSNAIDTAFRDSTPNFSITGWFKLVASGNLQERKIFSKYENFSARDRCFLLGLNASNQFEIYGQYNTTTSSCYLATTQTFTSGNSWTHFCFVYDCTQTTSATIAKLYINGVENTSWAIQTVSTTNKFFYNQTSEASRAMIGSVQYAGASVDTVLYGFNGYLDELSFWDKSLSSAEVTELYNAGDAYNLALMTAYSTNNLGWWRMGDNAGDNWDGSKWNIINVKGTASTDLISANLVEADRVTDVP